METDTETELRVSSVLPLKRKEGRDEGISMPSSKRAGQLCPVEMSAAVEVLSQMVATSHTWLLSTLNVTCLTGELNLSF